jgi:hypothetical protein
VTLLTKRQLWDKFVQCVSGQRYTCVELTTSSYCSGPRSYPWTRIFVLLRLVELRCHHVRVLVRVRRRYALSLASGTDVTSVLGVQISSVRQQFCKKICAIACRFDFDVRSLAPCHASEDPELETILALPFTSTCVTRSSRSNAAASLRARGSLGLSDFDLSYPPKFYDRAG